MFNIPCKIGQAWAAATTEGLLIYSLDIGLVFDPFQLEHGITPDTVKETLNKYEYAEGINIFFRIKSNNNNNKNID